MLKRTFFSFKDDGGVVEPVVPPKRARYAQPASPSSLDLSLDVVTGEPAAYAHVCVSALLFFLFSFCFLFFSCCCCLVEGVVRARA